MSWTQVTLQTTHSNVELFNRILTESGAVSVTMQNGDHNENEILEPLPGENPLWDNTQVIGLFDASQDITPVVAKLKQKIEQIEVTTLEDKEWEREWMHHFKPICFANKLWICPSWCALPDPQAPHVLLDPGLAFGTGTHPTTALCLEWLATHLKQDQTVVDYGCGSGILGIAAKRLGADRVVCVDYDPQAIAATVDNAGQNHLFDQDLTACLPEKCPPVKADVVIANILAKPLIQLSQKLIDLLNEQGTLVLSGLLSQQANMVMEAYQHQIDFEEPTIQDDWVRLVGHRKSPIVECAFG